MKRLLEPHGFEPVETASIDTENVPDDVEVEEHELKDIHKRLPRDGSLIDIKRRMSGTIKKRDRGVRDEEKDLSGWEHALACQIIRAARDHLKVEHIDPQILAGIIKKLDRVYYGKFASDVETGRRSEAGADKRYYVSAVHALDAENMPQKPQKHAKKPKVAEVELDSDEDDEPEIVGAVADSSYWWDDDTKCLYFLTRNQKTVRAKRVSNFQVKLLKELTIDKADGSPDRAWGVQFTSAFGEERKFALKSKEFSSTRSLEEALSQKLAHTFVVAHDGHPHIKPALLELTPPEEVERYSIRAVPGWWTITNDDGEEERVFLLPSALGAISKNGLVPELRMRVKEELADIDDEISRDEFELFGLGVRPPSTGREKRLAWRALRSLVECAPPEITMPIILQVMMGPLWTAGADEVPSLLHVSGPTGALKSSLCNAAMSLMGTFKKSSPPTANWGSVSPSALRSLLNAAKDLTILVDDYKRGVVFDPRGMRELVQSYADKATRMRLKSSGERRKTVKLQAVMLSNGEDRWENEASMVARTIFLDVKDYHVKDDDLRRAQNAINRGELQLLGGDWLSWLAGQDTLFADREIEGIREKWNRRLLRRTREREMHRRLLASVSTMAAVGDIFLQFVAEKYPKHLEEAKRWVKTAINVMVYGTKARAKQVKQLAPLQQFLGFIASEMEARNASLLPVAGVSGNASRLPDSPNAAVIGWWSDSGKEPMMHLNESTAFGWYTRQMRQQGKEVTFSWHAVIEEAKSEYGAKEHRMRIGKQKRQIRLISLPLSHLNLDEKREV